MTVEAKARRLVETDAVRILDENAEVVVAEVAGDSATYRVTRSRDGAFEGCSCPAVARCSHAIATEIVTTTDYEERTMYAPDDPARPFVDPDHHIDPETGEVLREYIDGQSAETDIGLADETAEDAPDEIDIDSGPNDTGVTRSETPVPQTVGDAPSGGVEAALLPLADAPVTFQTLKAISRTEFVPGALRGKPEAVLAAVLTGREMGLDPMEALRSIDVIDGRPAPSAELLARMIRAAGHSIEALEMNAETVRLRGTRTDNGETLEVAYTLADAERAGLVDIDEDGTPRARSQAGYPKPWELYTADMLWARAITRLWRRLFTDVNRLGS